LRRLLTAALVVAIPVLTVAPTRPAGAATVEHILTDARVLHTATVPTNPAFNSPPSWKSPVNYADGRAVLRLQVFSKPSAKLVKAQFCMWRHGTVKHQYETCSGAVSFTGPGTYTLDMGKPSSWWKKSTGWDWTKAPDKVRVMLKDASTGRLLLSAACLPTVNCYTGNDLSAHLPIDFRATVTLTGQGTTGTDPGGSLTITDHPDSVSVAAGQTATFRVAATSTRGSVTYQWRRNGTPIAGATSASYTTAPVTTADSGAAFTVVVSDGTATATPKPPRSRWGAHRRPRRRRAGRSRSAIRGSPKRTAPPSR
jgi:hypothetical protein